MTGRTPPGVRLRPLGTQNLVVLCHPEHSLGVKAEIDLESLCTESLIGFPAGWGAHMLARRAFAAAGLDYRAAMEVNDVHPLLDLVGYNLGVAIVPETSRTVPSPCAGSPSLSQVGSVVTPTCASCPSKSSGG